MKIRVRYFILIVAIVFICAYCIGCKFPIFSLIYTVNDAPVDPGVHIGNFINLFVCIGSFCAVIVALFKAELQGLFKSVELSFRFAHSSACEVLAEESTDTPKAKLYYNDLIVTNNGNINALNSQIQIDTIEFKRDQDVHNTSIPIDRPKLRLGTDEITFISANGGYKRIRLFSITSSQDPDGNIKNNLKVGENTIPCDCGGTWMIKCCINVENAKPYNINCEIKWDGIWHSRINEMQIVSEIK